MPKNSKRKGRRAGRSTGFPAVDGSVNARRWNPPMSVANLTFRNLRFSFLSSNSGTPNITDKTLQGVLAQATGTTTLTAMFAACRLRMVEVWCPPAGTSSNNSIELTLDGPTLGESFQTFRASSMGVVPGYMKWAPKKGDNLDLWQGSSAGTVLFVLNIPASCRVDVVLDCVLATAVAGVAITSSGLTTGQIYYGPLDGHSGILVPVVPSGQFYG